MLKDVDKELNWEEILVKFNSYEGKIIDFCRENNISHHQLYYHFKIIGNSCLEVPSSISNRNIRSKENVGNEIT